MFEHKLNHLTQSQLIELAKDLQKQCDYYKTKMLNKSEVADRAGMTISWLNNSYCNKAHKLRSIGVRYGSSRTSPIRFPLTEVIAICREDER